MSLRNELFLVPPPAHGHRRAQSSAPHVQRLIPSTSVQAGAGAGAGARTEAKGSRESYINTSSDSPPSKPVQALQLQPTAPPSANAQPPAACATRGEHGMLIYTPWPGESLANTNERPAPYARVKLHTITADQLQRTGIVEYRLINYLTLLANEVRAPLPIIPPNPAARVHDNFPPELFASRVHFYVRDMRCVGPAISTVMRIAQSNRSLSRYTLQDWLVGQAGIDYPINLNERSNGYVSAADLSLEQQRDVWDSPLRHLFYQVLVAHCTFQYQRIQVGSRGKHSVQALYEFVLLADRLRDISSDFRW